MVLELPENFNNKYVSVVYGVDNEKKLGINAFTWRKTIQVPSDGLLLTSSEIDENLPNTDFKTYEGIFYNSKANKKMFVQIADSELKQNGKIYKVRTWLLSEGECLVSSSKQDTEYQKQLNEVFNKKASR